MVPFIKEYLEIQGLWHGHMNFRLHFSISVKNDGILAETILRLEISLVLSLFLQY